MSTVILPHTNGHPQPPNGHRRLARAVPILTPLRAKVDHLAELRHLIRQAETAERELTAEIVRALQAAGVDRLTGRDAMATLGERTTLTPDPALVYEALGPRAFDAMSVSVTAARRLMAADDLAAISESTTAPVLRVERIEEVA